MKKITLLAFMALALCACNKINEIEEQPVVPAGPNTVTFTAEFTKTATANDQTVTWVAGDSVKFVWAGGSVTATASASGSSTTFSVEVADGIDELYAVYPASAGGAYDSGSVKVNFNGSRSDGSFAANDICVAKAVKNGNDWNTTLAFKNVACLFKISVTGSEYDQIQIQEKNRGVGVSGRLSVNIDGNTVTPGDTTYTGTSMNLSINGPGTYYIPVLPDVTFKNGFMIKLLKKGNIVGTPFYYNGSFTTERGKILKFPDIDGHAGHYYVKPDGSGDYSGRNWSNAMSADQFKTFIETNDNHTILRGATFHLSANSFDFDGYLKPDFDGRSVDVNFTIQGMKQGSDSTIFVGRSGADAGSLELLYKVNVTVKNVRFTSTSGDSNKAAIRVTKNTSTLNLENCYFDNNSTVGQGAAVNIINGANVNITNCEFKNNSAIKGASIHVENATAVIKHCTFKNNSGDGNALHIPNKGANVSMTDCDISGGNKCTVYGENDKNTSASTVSFTSVKFHDNHAVSESGAAAWLEGLGSYTFTNCEFIDNAADYRGGAIGINSSDVTVSFIGGKFQGNHADGDGDNYAGGAICVNKGSFDCTNVLFKENYSFVGSNTNAGGIIRLTSSGDCARFNGCVFDNNWSCRSTQSGNSCAAIINCRNGGTKFYFNACEFKNNSSGRGYSDNPGDEQGGKSGQVMAVWAGATIGMNNCSMHDNFASRNADDGQIYWICMGNGNSKLILSNSTVIGDQVRRPESTDQVKSKNGVIRFDADCYIHLINSIICSKYSNGKSVGCKATYDVPAYYCKVSPGLDSDTNWTNTTGFGDNYWADSSCFGGWSAPYTWNGTLTGTNSSMKAATSDVNTQIQSADADFYAWLNSIGALGKDINGKSRGATSWPGCYQN